MACVWTEYDSHLIHKLYKKINIKIFFHAGFAPAQGQKEGGRLLSPCSESHFLFFLCLKIFDPDPSSPGDGEMCPLRVLLIFLSATLAGFFVLRGLKSQPEVQQEDQEVIPKEAVPLSIKVRRAISAGFWTCVDMASGRYLWRTLVSPSSSPEKKQS